MSTLLATLPNEVAERLIGRRHLSWSAISTYQSCSLKFAFRYLEGLPEETVSASLIFGSAIHSSIQVHFEELLAGNPAPDLNTLLDAYRAEWSVRESENVKFGKGDDAATLEALAERMLAAFQESDLAKPEGAILGIEEELRGPVIDGCPDLLARLDLVVENDDELVVTDFKTSRSRWSTQQFEQSIDQLLLYHEIAGKLAGDKPVRLQFSVITKANNPTVEVYSVPTDPGGSSVPSGSPLASGGRSRPVISTPAPPQ